MKIEIFDVELGQCAMIHCPNGEKVMVDAGHNASRPWFPSLHFYGAKIEKLVVTNFDEDHVSNYVEMHQHCSVRTVLLNQSVSATELFIMKRATGGMGKGISAIHSLMQASANLPNRGIIPNVGLGGVEMAHYYLPFGAPYTDTNNLSVLTFARYGSFCICFSGDLEVGGWQELLKRPEVCRELQAVTVFVASHHGRESGCCPEVFNYCSPQAIIISDESKRHDTQDTSSWYASQASGCVTADQRPRKVITTRNDGHITINTNFYGQWTIATEKNSVLWGALV